MKIIVCGAFGRLGAAVCKVAAETLAEVVAGTDVAGSDSESAAFPVYTEISLCRENADVVICCVPPTASAEISAILEYSATRKIPLVLCTTGMSPEVEAAIAKATESVAVLRSANMSLGINLLSGLLRRVATLLPGFDIEIIEKHHNQKIDAPSGTALALANAINGAFEESFEYVYDRSGERKKRGASEIGIHTLRGGTIVGEHSVIFAGCDEVIEFNHQALSKEVFAAGALKAARFIKGKPPGFYSMQNIIDGV